MGRSDNAGVFHYTKAEANEMIMRQANMGYMKGFRPGATPEERARAYRTYSPPGAKNDVFGTNATKQSETDRIIEGLNRNQPTTSSRRASGHTIHAPQTIHIHGNADQDSLAQFREHLHNSTADLLRELQRADDLSYSTNFV
jgi:hypothetical protein